jgi:hypothetical protein
MYFIAGLLVIGRTPVLKRNASLGGTNKLHRNGKERKRQREEMRQKNGGMETGYVIQTIFQKESNIHA